MPSGFEFTQPRFVLCEGPDDKQFLEMLTKRRPGIPEFQIRHAAECNDKQQGGRSGFRLCLNEGIRALAGFSKLKAFLIISDNDEPSSFSDVRDEIAAAGHAPPADANGVGDILGKPVAIRMIPNAIVLGDLESLSLPTIHETWPKARICVPLFLRCTGALTLFGKDNWPKRSSISKARARAATVGFNSDDPYKGVGHLFQRGTLSIHHSCFNELADFFRNFDATFGL
jgi:hypothetical protein